MKQSDREYYENLEMPERSRSRRPTGFKHYTEDELFEHTGLELSLLWYKIKSMFIGNSYNDGEHRKRKYDHDYFPIVRKVVYIDEEYKPIR